MSLLAPLYALGLLAIGLPIIFHLIQRRPQGEVDFSSLMFLKPSPPRMTRRSRLDNLLLLLLRATALILLAAAFTRPLWRTVALRTLAQPDRRTVLLIDTSASMQREDLWQQAVEQAEQYLADLQPGDEVALMSFDDGVRAFVSFDDAHQLEFSQRTAAVKQALEELAPTDSATDLGTALVTTADMLQTARETSASNGTLPPSIVLVSDLQRGSQLQRLEEYAWPAEIHVDVRRVSAQAATNAHAVVIQQREPLETPTGELPVRVYNAGNSSDSRFKLGWVDAQGQPLDDRQHGIDVPPGESRVVRVARSELPHGRLVLSGDDQAFDNTRYVARQDAVEKTLLYLGDDAEDIRDGLLYYLRRATLDTTRQSVSIEQRTLNDPLETLDPDTVPLVVLAGPLPEESTAALLEYLHDGGRVLAVLLGDSEQHPALTESLRSLTTIDTLSIEEAEVDDYAMLSAIDFQHPIFRPFADPRFSDFTKIRFWGYRRMTVSDESPWTVLARFDDQSPALVEREYDDGRLWILTAGWQPNDSQLALSTKFVPLLAGMVDSSGGDVPILADYVVGERLSLPGADSGAQFVRPDGAVVHLEDGADYFQLDQPGVYGLVRGTREQRFAVNLHPAESRTEPLEQEQLERYGIQFGPSETLADIQARQRQMRDVELENQQKLWRWMVVAALVVLAAETWLAGRLSHRAPAVE